MGDVIGNIFGAGQSALGGLFGGMGASANARAINSAGNRALTTYRDQTYLPQLMSMIQGSGTKGLDDMLAMTSSNDRVRLFGADPTFFDQSKSRMGDIDKRLAEIKAAKSGAASKAAKDSLAAEEKNLKNEYEGLKKQLEQAPSKGLYDLSAIRSQAEKTPGFLNEYDNALIASRKGYEDTMNRWDADTKQLQGTDAKTLADYDAASRIFGRQGAQDVSRAQYQTGDLVGTAKQFGKGREDIIRRDAQRGLNNANAGSTAEMIASGLGASTLTQNAKAQNARTYGDIQSNALQSLGDSQLSAIMGAKQWGYGNENEINQAGRNRMLSREGGRTALQGQQTDRLAGRMAGGSGIQERNADRNTQLGMQAPMLKYSMFQSPQFNPFLGMDTTRYFPGASPGGAFMSSVGNSMSAAGGLNSILQLLG